MRLAILLLFSAVLAGGCASSGTSDGNVAGGVHPNGVPVDPTYRGPGPHAGLGIGTWGGGFGFGLGF